MARRWLDWRQTSIASRSGGRSDREGTTNTGVQIRRYALAATACAATTVVTHLLAPYFDLANIVMVFLLSVVGVAVWLGRGPSVLAAFDVLVVVVVVVSAVDVLLACASVVA